MIDAGPACDLNKPFGTAALVPGINSSAADLDARLAADELTIFFSSNRQPDGGTGPQVLWVASRNSVGDAFTSPTPLVGVAIGDSQWAPTLSGDGLDLVFTNYHPNADLFLSHRASPSNSFPLGAVMATVNTPNVFQGQSYLRADAGALYFGSNRPGGKGGVDLYRTNAMNGVFATPTPLSELNTPADEQYPTVSTDDLTIYFSSTRTDLQHQGPDNIFMSRRTSTAVAFELPPVNVAELNSIEGAEPTWLSLDGCRIYFQSSRPSGVGGADIYFATKPK